MATLEKTSLKDQLAASDISVLPGSQFPEFAAKREKALAIFAAKGFPGKKDEEYKYANIRPFLKDITASAEQDSNVSAEDISKVAVNLEDAIRLVFVNGRFEHALSDLKDQKGLTIDALSNQLRDQEIRSKVASYADSEDPFVALNTALWTDGTVLRFGRNCIVQRPVYCLHIATSENSRMNQHRFVVVMEEGASATIIEHYETAALSAVSFTNNVSEIVLKSDAILHHYILQNECENGVMVNSTNTCLEGRSIYHINTVTVNGAFVRNNLSIVLNSPHAEAHLYGLYLANDTSLVDNHTLVDHRVPDCNSNELYKGIIDGKATGVFNGKIFVRQDAQKTNAFQSNKNILLSNDASMNTKPQLEIYADDVKCSHGSSTGQFDPEAMFYLRARGLSQDSARKLMIQAFADDVLNNIKQEDLRKFISELVSKKLG